MRDRTITLFNLHKASGLWYPTVLNNVSLNAVHADNATANAGIVNADVTEAIIRVSAEQSVTDAGSGNIKRYAGSKEYAKLENPAAYFTFTPEQDFFIEGDYESDEPVSDDESDDGFYHAMNRERDGVYMIQSAAYYSLIPHFEIGGR